MCTKETHTAKNDSALIVPSNRFTFAVLTNRYSLVCACLYCTDHSLSNHAATNNKLYQGAYAALQLFPNLQTNHGWKKLICLGAGIHTNNMTEKIQSSPQSKSPEVSPFLLTPANTLLVQASNDGFRRFYNDQDLISVVTVAKVQGGNHAGVAYYGPQTFPIRDGQRDISLETQQDLTAVAIAEFLRNRQ